MTNLQRLSVRLSDIRQRLNEVAGLEGDAFTDDIRQESDRLQVEFRDKEPSTGRPRSPRRTKTRPWKPATRKPVSFSGSPIGRTWGDILSATFEKRQTSGATAELQQHHGIGSHQAPLEMLRINRSVEERAAATVPASIGDASQAQVVTPVFASGDGAFLQIERPTVPVGDAAYPVLSTLPSVKGLSLTRLKPPRPTLNLWQTT